ncbi:hypothetical protein [Methylobacterium sp. 1973]|uniref:hypothetical protein n=1 Tax=Methylobacterium sp. 1973 TaxID=3156421 RepID=UPI003398B790
MSQTDPRPPAADGEREEGSTFDEALAYLRPHKLESSDAPVVLKAGMLRCCVSAILMREADTLSRLTAAEAGREEAEAYGREVGSALIGLTCDGSEFYRRGGADWRVDPAACAAYVRRQRSDKHDSILRFAKRAKEAEAARDAALARVEKLEKALGVAQSALAMLTEPNEIRSTSVAKAWAVAVDAELKCRQALTEAQPKGDQ